MDEGQKSVSKWILIASALFALMEVMVSLSLFFSPEEMLENVDHGAKGVDFLVKMWATRQFALGFIFAFATFRKSRPMLSLAYVFLLVMFAGDLTIGFLQRENSLIMAAMVMCAISSALLYALNKKNS